MSEDEWDAYVRWREQFTEGDKFHCCGAPAVDADGNGLDDGEDTCAFCGADIIAIFNDLPGPDGDYDYYGRLVMAL